MTTGITTSIDTPDFTSNNGGVQACCSDVAKAISIHYDPPMHLSILKMRLHAFFLLCTAVCLPAASQPNIPPRAPSGLTGTTIRTAADGGKRRLSRVVLFGDGSRLAIIIRLQTDTETKDEFTFFDVATGTPMAGFASAGEHVEEVSGSPDGSRVALQIVQQKGSDRTLRVCDAHDGKKICEYHSKNGIMPCFFSADGGQILMHAESTQNSENSMQLMEVASGKVVSRADIESFDNPRAMSPDRTLIVSTDGNGGLINLASLKTGHLFRTIRDDQKREALAAMFLPDGKKVQALYADGTVLRWEVETGKLLSRVNPQKPVPPRTDMVFSADGERVVMRDGDSLINMATVSGKELSRFQHGPNPNSYAEMHFTKSGYFAVRVDWRQSGEVVIMKLPTQK